MERYFPEIGIEYDVWHVVKVTMWWRAIKYQSFVRVHRPHCTENTTHRTITVQWILIAVEPGGGCSDNSLVFTT